MRMKSVENFGVASLVLVGILGAAYAAPKTPVSKPAAKPTAKPAMKSTMKSSSAAKISQMTGTVISATRTSLTVKPSQKRFGAKKTISVPASASVMLGSKKVALSSLKAGEKVTVTMKGSTVTRISAAPGSVKPHVSKTHKA